MFIESCADYKDQKEFIYLYSLLIIGHGQRHVKHFPLFLLSQEYDFILTIVQVEMSASS